MKKLIIAILCFVSHNLLAQGHTLGQPLGQSSESYLINEDGVKTYLYGNVSMSAESITFSDASGKNQYEKQKNIKSLVTGNRLFINLPITSIQDRLQEVIAYNDKYILTAYWHNGQYLYIYDKDYEAVEKKILLKHKKWKVLSKEKIMPYFGDCPTLMKKINSNANKKYEYGDLLFDGITQIKCGNSELKLK